MRERVSKWVYDRFCGSVDQHRVLARKDGFDITAGSLLEVLKVNLMYVRMVFLFMVF